MLFPQKLITFLSLARLVLGDPYTISLGDVHTYAVTVTTTGALTGSTLSVQLLSTPTSAAIPQNGVNCILSPDLQTNVNSILGRPECGANADEVCSQALNEAFSNASLDIQARQLQIIPIIILGLVLAQLAVEISLIYGSFKPNDGIFLPPEQLTQMVAAASATEIAFATGTAAPYASITPPPVSTTIPIVSIATETASLNGQSSGDVTISIPGDLAGRIQEVLARESCFGLNKRVGDISNAICGGQALVFESQPAGSLFELQFVQGIADGNPFNLQWATETLNDGANQVIEYAQSLAPVLQLGASAAAALGALAFALALVQDVDGNNIQTLNTIPATAIDIAAVSQPCAITSCSAGCDMTGAIQRCSTACNTISTASSCNTSPDITTTAFLNIETGPLQSVTCTPASTLFPLSLQSINHLFGTQYYYTCGEAVVAINLAVSGTSTLSYPAYGQQPPVGFTQIPVAGNGQPYTPPATLPTTEPPLPFSPTYSLPSVTLVVSDTPKGTSAYCDPYWCGAPFCGPCPTGEARPGRGGHHYGVIHKE